MNDRNPAPDAARAPKLSFVSLGCPKALVDSERIITRLRAEGYELARKHDGADIVIVNTCGFLDSAKQESLSAIGDAMAENGKVIVTGCMGAEPEQISTAYPGVLSITGPQQYESVLDAVHRALPPAGPLCLTGRRRLAYLKPRLRFRRRGRVAEWFKAAVLKTAVGATPP